VPADPHERFAISVIIPTHNRARWLEGAIASVLRSPVISSARQIIVVDDDSRDDTEGVAREYSVRYVRGVYRGPSGTRNAGLAVATSTYVNFLDDDDEWLPGNMHAQLAALTAHPQAGFAYGLAQAATEDMIPLPATWPAPPLASGQAPDALHLAYPQLGAVLFRRDAVVEVGGFDPRIRYQQDADLMLRIATRHEIIGVDVVGVLFRERDAGKVRSEYHWSMRNVTSWWPKGVGWRAALKFIVTTRGMFFGRFCDDAAACAAVGRRQDALVCLGRALLISPAHSARHLARVARTLRLCWTTSPHETRPSGQRFETRTRVLSSRRSSSVQARK
jgi:glycosyltransferase involved in cell wall biosynthesis